MLNVEKERLRKLILEKRDQLDLSIKAEYDQWICSHLENRILEFGYQHVHCYIPMRSEIDVVPLIKKLLSQGISVFVPKTLPDRRLEHYKLDSLGSLQTGLYGTSYPKDAQKFDGPFDLIIIPGAAFDKDLFRIGYGGGYYDVFLQKNPNSFKLGIAYPFQLVDRVPRESFDVPMDLVLTNELSDQ